MSLHEARDENERVLIEHFGLDPGNAEALCLFCGATVHHPGVLWAGAEGTAVYLHGLCAGELALRLAHDAIQAKRVRRRDHAR